MNTFIFIVNLVKLGNILIRGIIDILAYLKRKRQQTKDNQMQKTTL